MLNIDYKDKSSIYEQIVSGIKEQIVSGVYGANHQLPSVRELSLSLTVNPNTVQKAYRHLEQEGYIYSVRGKGCFVAQLSGSANSTKAGALIAELESCVKELKYLNVDYDKILSSINGIYKEGEK